jgi:hypothetical protein
MGIKLCMYIRSMKNSELLSFTIFNSAIFFYFFLMILVTTNRIS